MKVARRNRLLRFGPFVVDRKAHEVRRDGILVHLQEKQFRLLIALLEHPNEVVTRAELHQALWPEEDFGEFDIGLNQAVRRLRRALEDSAVHPIWIETVPKVGYRFIGRITTAPNYRRVVAAALGVFTASLIVTVQPLRFGPPPVSAALDVATLRETAPRFSPDGARIVYTHRAPASNSWNIFVEEVGSRKPLQLTNSPEQDLGPAWSPDGRSIAFIRRVSRMADSSLMMTPASGGPLTKLADLNCRDVEGLALDWSREGSRIAFASRSEPTGPIRIGLFDVARSVSTWLTKPETGLIGDTQPAFSPDGSRLAFVRRAGYTSGWNVFVLELGGDFTVVGAPRPVTHFERMATSPRWSLEGERILFLGERGAGQEGIWSTSAFGSGEPKLLWRSPEALLDSGPSGPGHSSLAVGRSADGELLMAITAGAPRDSDVYRVELTGPRRGKASKLIATSFRDTYPQYSPDGSRIVFHSGAPTRDLWLADANGKNLTQITHLESRVVGPPSWSPDGRKIAFHSRHAGPADIYVVDADTHELRPLINSPSDDAVPTWSRDGKRIYFLSNRSGDWAIWQVASQGGTPVKLLDRMSPTIAESYDGRTLLFNDSQTGDFLESLIESPADPALVLAEANREVRAFVLGRSGLYFLARRVHVERSALRSTVGGMLSLVHMPSRNVQQLFPVQGYLSSVARDESHVLTVYGPEPAVDLRLLRLNQPS